MISNDPADIPESTGGIRIFNDPSFDWTVSGNDPLFIRKCHDDIFQKTFEVMQDGGSGIIMIGNPGLGKSFSIPYHLWRFTRAGRTVVVHSSKLVKTWVFNNDQTRVLQGLSDLKTLHSKIDELNDEQTVFLWDPDENEHTEPPTMNVSLPVTQVFTHSLILFTRHLPMCCWNYSLTLICFCRPLPCILYLRR